jgi:alpha-beta hydrolase superfamily lysophospholipase
MRAPADDGAAPPARRIPGLNSTLQRRARLLFRMVTALSPALAARLAARLFVTPYTRPISAEEARFVATAKSRRLRAPSGEIQVYDWPSAGPTVLVLHGWISHAARLQGVIEALRARGLHVVTFDAPAHGRSHGSRADLHSFTDALDIVSKACGPVAAILAHSFGALTAASWLAGDGAPSTVRAAVLVGLPRDVGYLFDSFVIAMGLRDDVRSRLRSLFHSRYGRFPEQYSARELAQRIRIPVLLVHGGADDLVPARHAVEIAARLRQGRVHVVPEMNHSGPLHDPETIALMSDFIAERLITPAPGAAPAPVNQPVQTH